MSIYGIEDALWQASMNPVKASSLREDAESYLQDFRIDDEERSLVTQWDIRALLESGVNPMVLMMANAAVNGPEAAGAYIEKANTPRTI